MWAKGWMRAVFALVLVAMVFSGLDLSRRVHQPPAPSAESPPADGRAEAAPGRAGPPSGGRASSAGRDNTATDARVLPTVEANPVDGERTPLSGQRWLPLSADDEAVLDQVAVEFEGDRVRQDIARLNALFEAEPRDPEWAAKVEADLVDWMHSAGERYAGARVGAPVCKASICLLRAFAPLRVLEGGSSAGLPEVPIHVQPWRDRFDGASSHLESRNAEAVVLTYLYRRCAIEGTC